MFKSIKISIAFFSLCLVLVSCKKSSDDASVIGSWKIGSKYYHATLTYPMSNLNPINSYYALVAMPKLASTAHPDMFQVTFKTRPSTSGVYKIQQKINNDLLPDEVRIEAWEEEGSSTAFAKTEGKNAIITVINGKISVEVPLVNAFYTATINGIVSTTSTTMQGSFTEQ